MSGDWIKMRVILLDEPEVIGIAADCGLEEYAVVGRLLRLWGWADQHTRDGNAPSVTKEWIDRYLHRTGFADAMQRVGWLTVTDSGVRFPNFDRHNSKSAKTRALTAARVSRHKASNADGNAPSVTDPLPREEKREKREEENTNTGSAKKFVRPTVEEVAAYCRERGNGIAPQAFVDHYNSNGWKIGKSHTPMKDWQAAVRTWENRQREDNPQPAPKSVPADQHHERTQEEIDALFEGVEA